MTAGISIHPDETLDDLLHGELKLIQPRDGYRYSVDALLLAAFALPLVAGETVLDLGAGSGVIGLILAKRGAPARVVGVELQPGLADLALRNAALNATDPPLEIIRGDATRLKDFPAGSFGVIVTNPPFRPLASGEVSPNPEKAAARHEVHMTLLAWLKEAKRLLKKSGRLCLVYPVDREQRLLAAVRDQDLHIARRVYALDRPGGARKLVLLELSPLPATPLELPDLPIETSAGRFSLDGYR